MKIEEIRIPAPWGHIAAKAWGNSQDEIVLVSHGLLDNAGSFDNLIPLLSKDYYYVCVDLPGHGRSSHFDHSLPLYTVDFVLPMKIVCNYFGKTNYIYIGHSYSGQIATIFSLVYPNCFSKIIYLDFVGITAAYPVVFANKLKTSQAMLLNTYNKKETLNSQQKPKSYKECVDRVIQRRVNDNFKWEHAEPLVRRMVEQIGEGDSYVFTYDKRLGHFMSPSMTMENVIELLRGKAFQCPTLFLLMTEVGLHVGYSSLYNYMKTVKNVEIRPVYGHHNTHNTDPEKICGYINRFLMQKLNKLW